MKTTHTQTHRATGANIKIPAMLAMLLEQEAKAHELDLKTYCMSVLVARGLKREQAQFVVKNREVFQ